MTEYPYLPPACRNGTCGHTDPGCTSYRSRRCLSGECLCASRMLACGVHDPAPTTEVQPPAAEATVHSKWATRPLDARPYCCAAYALDKPNPFDGTRPWLISWSCWQKPAYPAMRTFHDAALYETARVRVDHQYHGPMRVVVWQKRDDEHYRADPPADAYALTTGIDTL